MRSQKIILLAPHLEYPPRNGGDIYIERLGCHLSAHRGSVFILGVNTLTRYEMGANISQNYFSNNLRTKPWAAIRTSAFKSHYLIEKFLTNTYRQKARELVLENPEAVIIYSLILSASLELTTKPAIIITQNDEITWFQNQFRFSNNPLQKLTARISENWTKKFLQKHTKDFVYAHITESDYQSYKHWIPEHDGFVVPAGVYITKLSNDMPWDGIVRLLFVGSLSVKTNYDALAYFQNRFWPVLKDEFKDKIEMTVLGSKPSAGVRQLCQREHWQLLPDASEEELQTQYGRATFAILPFLYTTGAKLKLLNALAAGLPVLATTNMKILPRQGFAPNLYSDEPQEWRSHLKKFMQQGISPELRTDCQAYVARYSWENIAAYMDKELRKRGF